MEGGNSKKRHARSGSGGGSIASFFKSTAASFSFSRSSFSTTTATTTTKKRSSFNHRNAFSGPIMVVPPEARGRRRRGSGRGSGYRTPEPSSPKVSCIGQIKKSRSKPRNKVKPCGEDGGGACKLPPRPPARPSHAAEAASRPKTSLVKRIFFRRSRSRSSSTSSKSSSTTGMTAAAADRGLKRTAFAAAPAPAAGGLGQMKRFTSGRAAFQDFDWRDEPAPAYNDDDDDYEYDDGFVAHSAPLVLGGGMVASEPRKEVNLWRRRPMSPPKPLELP